MGIGYHCDFPDCDTWTYTPWEHGFVGVMVDKEEDHPKVFCCMDHAGRWLILNSQPIEEIPDVDL
jgi:hypothetical protein